MGNDFICGAKGFVVGLPKHKFDKIVLQVPDEALVKKAYSKKNSFCSHYIRNLSGYSEGLVSCSKLMSTFVEERLRKYYDDRKKNIKTRDDNLKEMMVKDIERKLEDDLTFREVRIISDCDCPFKRIHDKYLEVKNFHDDDPRVVKNVH